MPGNTPNMIINGDALGADSIILDLEDAVSPDEKGFRKAARSQRNEKYGLCGL